MATTTANTAGQMVRSTPTTALKVAFRELELYYTGNVAGADEVFSPDVTDHNAADPTAQPSTAFVA